MLELKYLFHCQFNDGETFVQNKEDKSFIDETKSAFTDLLKKAEEKSIDTFSLTDNVNTYLVDLRDGHFEINGIPFFAHEQTFQNDLQVSNFRLIYYRRNQIQVNTATNESSIPNTLCYIMGWQANQADGKNIQKLIYIK